MSRVDGLTGRAKIALSTMSQTFGNAVVAVGAVAVVRLVTHRLGPTDYGEFVLVITYVNLFSLIADLGVTAITTRQMAIGGADRSSILSVVLSFRATLSIAVIPLILGSAAVLYPHRGRTFGLALAIMSCDVLFTALQTTAASAFAVRVRGDLIAAFMVANRVLYVIGVALVASWRGSYVQYIAAYVGADLIVAAIMIVGASRTIAFRWDRRIGRWWATAKVAFPLGIIQLVGNVYSWVDSILVSLLRSNSELGYYSLAFNVYNICLSLPSFLMLSLVPSLVDRDRSEVERLLNRACYVLVCVGAPLAAGGVVLRADAVTALAGHAFSRSATPLALLMAALPLSFVQTALGYTSVAIDNYRPMLAVAVGTVLANVGANLLLIPAYGPTGAAAALLGSEVFSVTVTYLVFRRLTGIRVRWRMLWRPVFAASAVFLIAPARGRLWASSGPILAPLTGGGLTIGVYVLALVLVGGTPHELRGLMRRGVGSQAAEHD